MSDIHDEGDRPRQYRVPCQECGKKKSDYLRMHSHLSMKHVRQLDGVSWNDGVDQVQCNNCGNVRTVE